MDVKKVQMSQLEEIKKGLLRSDNDNEDFLATWYNTEKDDENKIVIKPIEVKEKNVITNEDSKEIKNNVSVDKKDVLENICLTEAEITQEKNSEVNEVDHIIPMILLIGLLFFFFYLIPSLINMNTVGREIVKDVLISKEDNRDRIKQVELNRDTNQFEKNENIKLDKYIMQTLIDINNEWSYNADSKFTLKNSNIYGNVKNSEKTIETLVKKSGCLLLGNRYFTNKHEINKSFFLKINDKSINGNTLVDISCKANKDDYNKIEYIWKGKR